MGRGKRAWIVDESGEILESGRFKSEAQMIADRKWCEKEKAKDITKRIGDKFIWTYFEEQTKIFPELKPQDISRLIYIATYCDYKDNILKFRNKVIDSSKLKEMMLLSNPQYYKWYNLMLELKYIEITEDGYKLNSNFFSKGGMAKNSNSTRLFINTIRNLYENIKTSDHYKLGYLLQLIPYINPYNNALVENVYEKDMSKLKPLRLGHLADILGYSRKNAKKLGNELLSIKYGKNQTPLIGLLALNSLQVDDMYIIINAKLFFGGTTNQYHKINGLFENNNIMLND